MTGGFTNREGGNVDALPVTATIEDVTGRHNGYSYATFDGAQTFLGLTSGAVNLQVNLSEATISGRISGQSLGTMASRTAGVEGIALPDMILADGTIDKNGDVSIDLSATESLVNEAPCADGLDSLVRGVAEGPLFVRDGDTLAVIGTVSAQEVGLGTRNGTTVALKAGEVGVFDARQ